MSDESLEGRPSEEGASPEPPVPSPEAPAEADARERLQAALEAKGREAAEHYDRYLRALADFENYRRRVQREREEWTRLAQERLLRDLLPVLDNFDRALQVDPDPGQLQGFVAGIELIRRELLKVLERIGVISFSAVGEPFDPQRHEAVMRVETTEVPSQTVVEEIERGYLLGDRVLRPARVKVAVHPEESASGPGGPGLSP